MNFIKKISRVLHFTNPMTDTFNANFKIWDLRLHQQTQILRLKLPLHNQ